MRVIAGEFRSRHLKTLPGLETRPTPDRLREALFNVIAPRIEGSVFVDAYAGTGAVGIEALSRGAERTIFIERNRAAARVIRDNLNSLGAADRADVIQGKVLQQLQQQSGDIVFLDPPYAVVKEYWEALLILGSNPPLLVIVQHESRFDPGDVHEGLERTRVLKQGDNTLSFYRQRSGNSTISL